MNENDKNASIPLYAKIGWAMAWMTMLVVVAMMLRNCATSVIYGLKTSKAQVDSTYKTGLKDGENGQGPALTTEVETNPVLHKSYTKGYREGLDHLQTAKRTSASPTAAKSTPPAKAATYADFSDFDLSTPQKAVVSFVGLFNGIMPVSPPADLTEICARSTTPAYRAACGQLLQQRVDFLKGIAKNLQGARFSYQPLAELSLKDDQGRYQATWKENFTFFDKTTQTNDKKMVLDLQKTGKEWRIAGVEE